MGKEKVLKKTYCCLCDKPIYRQRVHSTSKCEECKKVIRNENAKKWYWKYEHKNRKYGSQKVYWNSSEGLKVRAENGKRTSEMWKSGKLKFFKFDCPSPLQVMFFNFLVARYPEKQFVIEYMFIIPSEKLPLKYGKNKHHFWLDIVDIENKIDIEVDGKFWHSGKEAELRDKERDKIVGEGGWKVIRVPGSKVFRIIKKQEKFVWPS